MKIKVKPSDKNLLGQYYNILSVISVISSFLFLIYDIPDHAKIPMGIGILLLFAVVYLFLWVRANRQKKLTLYFTHSTIDILEGDLFACEGIKVITFNEYFDTLVDDVVISFNSLNGRYIQEYVDDVKDLDVRINADPHLQDCILEKTDRSTGKQNKYSLGTVFKDGEYFLMAFSKFDANNRAYITIEDYIDCLMNFWNECDIHCVGKTVSMTMIGTGITRFRGYDNVSEQELLELIIWTCKVSRVYLKVRIVLTKSLSEKINFYDLKSRFHNT